MTRNGIDYEHLPASVDLSMVHTVATPFKAGVSKLELARELIEAVQREAKAYGAGTVWVGDLDFRQLEEADGLQAYTYVVYFAPEAAA